MISDIRGRTGRSYAYLHAGSSRRLSWRVLGTWLSAVPLNARQKAVLLALAVCTVCAAFLFSAAMRQGIASVQSAAAEVEKRYLALENEHMQLLSTRAHLNSRDRISKMAETRFQLFEPTADQVQNL